MIGAASQSFAVVVVAANNEEMYRRQLNDAKARAEDFHRLEKERRAGHQTEAKEVDQYHEKVNSDSMREEKEREQYVEIRNTRPRGEREEVLEDRWNAEQAKIEEQSDKDRATYIAVQHRAQTAINGSAETLIDPLREFDLQDPKSLPLTDYLKAHPVKSREPVEKVSPNGAIISPGAKKISSPPPGGDSSFGKGY